MTPRSKRYPTARLPRTDRRYGAGVVFAAAVHALAILLLASGWAEVYVEGARDPGPGRGGGGGGGGGRSIRYIDLPPLPTSASRSARPAVKPAPRTEIVLPQPKVAPAEEKPILPNPTIATPDPVMPVVARSAAADSQMSFGPGTGTGVGPGVGAGVGGGQGTGRGQGIGSGTGPGSGGDGTAYYAPEPRAIIYPFEEPPASVRGREFLIRFWVDNRGRVDKVEIEPEIADRAFRAKLIERVSSWTFYPARTREGKPVNGRYEITYQP